jgi:DNA-binding NtrC family response regulator
VANILIVDDDRDVAEPLIMFLEFEGHKTRYAANGIEGLAAVSQRFPDLIFLDIDMPHLNGPEMAYRLLVEDCGREKIPVLIISGVPDIKKIAQEVGTPYFVPKPYALDDLQKTLSTALHERRAPQPKMNGDFRKTG